MSTKPIVLMSLTAVLLTQCVVAIANPALPLGKIEPITEQSRGTAIPSKYDGEAGIGYPVRARLLEVYDYMMRESGVFESSLFEAHPSRKTLRSVYDLARDTGRLGEIPTAYTYAPDDILGIDKPVSESTQKALSAACVAGFITCASSSRGMVLACSAAVLSAGGMTPLCAGVGIAWTLSCGPTVTNCLITIPAGSAFTTTSAGAVGEFPGTSTTKVCSDSSSVNRVTGLTVNSSLKFGSTRILDKVTLTCASGQTLVFDVGTVGSTPKTETSACADGKMVQGFKFNYGAAFDGIHRICDVATDTTTADTIPSTYLGGSGGESNTTKTCPEGSYVYGLRAWFAQNTTTKYFEGFEPLCRKQWSSN